MDEVRMRALGSEIMRPTRRRVTTYPGSVLDDSAFRILRVPVESLGEERDDELVAALRELNDALDRAHATVRTSG